MSEEFSEVEGYRFRQLWHHIPWLKPYYTDFENNVNPFITQRWMINNPWFPIVTVVGYLLFCYYGIQIMKNYKPFNLKYYLALWNLLLSVFSWWGTLRTAPHLFYNMATKTFESTVCEGPTEEWGLGATGLAVMLFVLSKFPELIDTVFIVLKKKELILLHWYHHVTVLLFCWNSFVTESGSGLYFITMNYFVHAIMYFYFFMQTIKCVPKWFPAWIITMLQISQMFIGIYVTVMAIYYYNYGGTKYKKYECNNSFSNLIAGSLMYASYAMLFLAFAFEKFLFSSSKSIKST